MSMMLPTPPRQIQIGGGAPSGGGAPGGPPAAQNGPGDPDSGNVVSLLKQALQLVQKAGNAEKDDGDAAGIHAIAASIAKQIGNEQGLVDKAMGAGPGVKLVRKSAPAGGSGYGGGM
jgi:hypothetical protein